MRLNVPSKVTALICEMHPTLKKKVRAGLKKILDDPSEGKALRFELEGLWSFRIGSFRIIYRIQKNTLDIVALGPRARIYEETYRLIKKQPPL